jgi:hypothetical protein
MVRVISHNAQYGMLNFDRAEAVAAPVSCPIKGSAL